LVAAVAVLLDQDFGLGPAAAEQRQETDGPAQALPRMLKLK